MLSGRFFGALNPRCHSLSRILMRWSQINVIHIGLVMLSGSRLSKMFHLLTMTMGLGLLSLNTYLPGTYFLILGPYPAFFAQFQNFGHIANNFMETLYIFEIFCCHLTFTVQLSAHSIKLRFVTSSKTFFSFFRSIFWCRQPSVCWLDWDVGICWRYNVTSKYCLAICICICFSLFWTETWIENRNIMSHSQYCHSWCDNIGDIDAIMAVLHIYEDKQRSDFFSAQRNTRILWFLMMMTRRRKVSRMMMVVVVWNLVMVITNKNQSLVVMVMIVSMLMMLMMVMMVITITRQAIVS